MTPLHLKIEPLTTPLLRVERAPPLRRKPDRESERKRQRRQGPRSRRESFQYSLLQSTEGFFFFFSIECWPQRVCQQRGSDARLSLDTGCAEARDKHQPWRCFDTAAGREGERTCARSPPTYASAHVTFRPRPSSLIHLMLSSLLFPPLPLFHCVPLCCDCLRFIDTRLKKKKKKNLQCEKRRRGNFAGICEQICYDFFPFFCIWLIVSVTRRTCGVWLFCFFLHHCRSAALSSAEVWAGPRLTLH